MVLNGAVLDAIGLPVVIAVVAVCTFPLALAVIMKSRNAFWTHGPSLAVSFGNRL